MRGLLLLIPAALLIFVALFWSQRGGGPFYVSGFIEADEVRVGSRVGGRVQQVDAVEGAEVEAGATLIVLEPYDLLERLSEAQAQLAARNANLSKLKAGFRKEEIEQARARRDRAKNVLDKLQAGPRPLEIQILRDRLAVAEADLKNAEAEYKRVAELFERDSANQNEMDDVIRLVDSARARHAASRNELSLAEEGTRAEEIAEAKAVLAEAEQALALVEAGYRAEDVAVAQAEVDAVAATIQVIREQIKELTVVAPEAGTVEAVELQPGDLVGPNAPLLTILLPKSLYVRAYVPENRLDVMPDQQVWIRVDSYPGETFSGRISYISRQGEFIPSNVQTPEERVKQVFRIKVSLEESEQRLRPGMSADVFFSRPE
ncbi:MAG: efflux RND transporter periplasmic adaptor subunit [Phycisphaerae bacterium]|nr:MAG: HlyD family efflux transporter periplasmic adaptor subunit [Planctomycetota bacterium]KAB2945591.1 MAG: HlyD family efflux transporter periplasmic adaptor subunit [Phycisphaerae bacterium]MBE7455426.1 efflux RND transporter periplasmic adaptor subunit [Planctomycetia bacterium]MCK6464976.1 efflux RND transporter periplasmic adaptor subunit [Phycisphaerae bacterium]MCL4719443.1 efflux RND transporter periplasmic adaptor subunit [Phycisphaerae bacterium]